MITMRFQSWWPLLLPATFALAACTTDHLPTSASFSKIQSKNGIVDGDGGEYSGPYMTTTQYAELYGETKPEFDVTVYRGEFYDENRRFKAKARFKVWLVTDVNASLTASVIDHSGATVNSNLEKLLLSTFLPIPKPIDTLVIALVSTNNHTSCVTGKSTASWSAKQELALPQKFERLKKSWEATLNKNGEDVTLGGCPTANPLPTPGGDSGACLGDGYWQQWFWYSNGEVTDEWWESICSSQAAT